MCKNAKICKRCGGSQDVDDARIFCKTCKPTKEQLFKWYIIESKSKKEIIRLLNLNYSFKLYEHNLTFLLRLYCLKQKKLKNKIKNQYIRIAPKNFKLLKNMPIYEKFDFDISCEEAIKQIHSNSIKTVKLELDEHKSLGEDDLVECKICGAKRKTLVSHVTKIHKISNQDYKRIFNAQVVSKKESEALSKRNSVNMKTAWKEGRCNYDAFIFKQRNINADEQILQSLSKNIVYVGGSKKGCKSLRFKTSYYRNPDFVVIKNDDYLKTLNGLEEWYEIQNKVTEDFRNGIFNIDKVIEYNGLYWHQKRFNGRTKEQYEQDEIDDYKLAKINCLVIWDNELKNINVVKNKIDNFVNRNSF
jgi:predicted Fe-S protein YdhL (DUF1289 family)